MIYPASGEIRRTSLGCFIYPRDAQPISDTKRMTTLSTRQNRETNRIPSRAYLTGRRSDLPSTVSDVSLHFMTSDMAGFISGALVRAL